MNFTAYDLVAEEVALAPKEERRTLSTAGRFAH